MALKLASVKSPTGKKRLRQTSKEDNELFLHFIVNPIFKQNNF